MSPNGYYEKYGVKVGDRLELSEEFTSKKYAFTLGGVYDYPATLAVFMNIDRFREIFDLEDDYYSGYFSNEELEDIPATKIASLITEEDLLTTSNQLEDSMGGAFRLFLIFSIILFLLLYHLLMQSFNGWMTFYTAPWGIPILIAMGMTCYILVSRIMIVRIRRIPMTYALKTQ